MNILFLIQYTSSMFFLFLIIYVLYKNPKSMLNRTCSLLLGCFAIWNFSTAYYDIAKNEEIAMSWQNISSVGWCSFPAFSLWFALVFTRKEKILKKWYLYLIILIIMVSFIYKQWTGYLINDNIIEPYGWSNIWLTSIWSYIFYAYYFSFMFISISLGYFSIKKAKYSYEKKQAVIIVITGIIPIIMGAITDILLPNLNVNSIPQLGDVFSLIWAIGIVYAITKYRLMTLTPAYAASDILSTMSDSLILIDIEGKIIEVNHASLKLLGYTREEITGGPVKLFFKEDAIQFLNEKESFNKHNIFLHTKDGEDIPVSLSVSKMKDKEGNLLGFVGVARDMREILMLQNKEKELAAEKIRTEALHERAQELQEAYDKLKTAQVMLIQSEKMAAVGQLAGGVAHDSKQSHGRNTGICSKYYKTN